MTGLTSIFSNREIAAFIWLAVFLGFVFYKGPKVRKQAGELISLLFGGRIFLTVLSSALYVALIVSALSALGFWTLPMLKDTIYWFAGTAFVMLLNLRGKGSGSKFMITLFKDSIKFLIILEFIVNLKQFSLVTELILIPIVTVIAMTEAYAKVKEPGSQVVSVLEWILAIFGFGLLAWSVIAIAQDVNSIAQIATLKDFLLPIVLTILYIPWAYLVALYMQYEILFQRFSHMIESTDNTRYAKRRLIAKCHINLGKLYAVGRNMQELYDAEIPTINRIIN